MGTAISITIFVIVLLTLSVVSVQSSDTLVKAWDRQSYKGSFLTEDPLALALDPFRTPGSNETGIEGPVSASALGAQGTEAAKAASEALRKFAIVYTRFYVGIDHETFGCAEWDMQSDIYSSRDQSNPISPGFSLFLLHPEYYCIHDGPPTHAFNNPPPFQVVQIPPDGVLHIIIWGVEWDDQPFVFERLGTVDVTYTNQDNFGEGYHYIESDAEDYDVEFYIWRCYDDFCRDLPPGVYNSLFN
jgi:hypothetical protein